MISCLLTTDSKLKMFDFLWNKVFSNVKFGAFAESWILSEFDCARVIH